MLEYLFTHTPLLFLVQDLWRDEAFSFVLAMRSIPDILHLTAGDFNPPLYYILLHFWMKLVGTSEIAMRSLSLLFFLSTIYILYDICLYVLKIPHRRTVVYFILFLCNPFLLTYAFEARMYMAVTFFVTLSYFALWTGRKKLYILAITLGLYTHYLSIFIYGIQALTVLFALWHQNRQRLSVQTHRNASLRILIPYIVPALLFLPWALFMIFSHNFSDGGFWIIQPPWWDIFYLPFVLYTSYERVFGMYYHERAGYTPFHSDLNLTLWFILFIPIATYLFKNRTRLRNLNSYFHIFNSKTFDIALWAFFPPVAIYLLSFIAQPLYLPRYYIFSSIGLLLWIVISFEKILHANHKFRTYCFFVALLLGLYLANATRIFNDWNLKYHSKRDVKSFYKEIQTLKKEADLIYMDSELDYHLALYYFGLDEKVYIYNKTYAGIPQYVGKVLIPADVVTHVLPIYPIRAFVVYYHWYNVRSLN